MSGLSKATVLIVEDHLQIRALIASVLQTFGVGNILRASNGAEAIKMLRRLRSDPVALGASRVDLVLSDWVMHPVDGSMLLRWIRRHKDSPNRFLPFIMITAYADPNRVNLARDLGVNEFLSKPFTAQSVASHLIAALNDERKFVKIGNYFGPDRRRRNELTMDEKRDYELDDVEKGVRFFDPPRELRYKLGDTRIDMERILQVQRELDSWSETFLDWTQEYIHRLERELAACRSRDNRARRVPFNRINLIAHELRGQGGTFGYPLVSRVARSLFELTLHNLDRSDACCDLIGEHIRTLRAVVRDRIRGDGGIVGRELVTELDRANGRFLRQSERLQLVSRAFQNSNIAALDEEVIADDPPPRKQLLTDMNEDEDGEVDGTGPKPAAMTEVFDTTAEDGSVEADEILGADENYVREIQEKEFKNRESRQTVIDIDPDDIEPVPDK